MLPPLLALEAENPVGSIGNLLFMGQAAGTTCSPPLEDPPLAPIKPREKALPRPEENLDGCNVSGFLSRGNLCLDRCFN